MTDWIAYRENRRRQPPHRRQYLVHGPHDGEPFQTWGPARLAARFTSQRDAIAALGRLEVPYIAGACHAPGGGPAAEPLRPDVVTLPPLDPSADYSRRSAAGLRAARLGIPVERLVNTRAADIPFWTAPMGYCRWCGTDLHARLRDGQVDPRKRWHTACADAYRQVGTQAGLRAAAWQRDRGQCVDCPPGTTAPVWEADHDVPLWAGGSHDLTNVVTRCHTHHAAKTAREAGERAARRRDTPEAVPLFGDCTDV